jgi:enoyl-CoA hydratase/carnithine racemase
VRNAGQGHAIGGGLGLAVACDLRVANREARYGANFVRLGLHPGMATTYIHPRLLGLPRAAELEAHAQSRTLETEDAREGIRALLERRDPIFKGR